MFALIDLTSLLFVLFSSIAVVLASGFSGNSKVGLLPALPEIGIFGMVTIQHFLSKMTKKYLTGFYAFFLFLPVITQHK